MVNGIFEVEIEYSLWFMEYKNIFKDPRFMTKSNFNYMYVCSITVVFSLECFFSGCVYAAVFPNIRENLPLISECTVPLKKCYDVDTDAEFREKCINRFKMDKCQNGTTYLCGYDEKWEFLIEKCVPLKECLPGKSLFYIWDLVL